LLLERTHEPFKGRWNLPAGYVEADESPVQAALRETCEEPAASRGCGVGRRVLFR
jgi:8-oxo-dGTP pyrophosphatase MutT (NUDIX family)